MPATPPGSPAAQIRGAVVRSHSSTATAWVPSAHTRVPQPAATARSSWGTSPCPTASERVAGERAAGPRSTTATDRPTRET